MGEGLLNKKRYASYKDPLVIALIVLIFVLVCRILFSARYVGIYVVGSSMSPTLNGAVNEDVSGGDYLYADTCARPDYGDIVVVEAEHDDGSTGLIIKRVIALGGDSVYMQNGVVYVMYEGTDSFVALEEDYVLPENNDPYLDYNSFRSESDPLVVPYNTMFLLGDNRGNAYGHSLASLYFGCFAYESMTGVLSEWSLSLKGFFTAMYTFFSFGVV